MGLVENLSNYNSYGYVSQVILTLNEMKNTNLYFA